MVTVASSARPAKRVGQVNHALHVRQASSVGAMTLRPFADNVPRVGRVHFLVVDHAINAVSGGSVARRASVVFVAPGVIRIRKESSHAKRARLIRMEPFKAPFRMLNASAASLARQQEMQQVLARQHPVHV